MAELYVPIHLEALVVGKGGMQVADMKPSFWELERKPLGNMATVKPFQKRSLEQGIHLHWTMPDALLHTTAQETEEALCFQQLPNRWVIQRLETKNGQILRKAWVVVSDIIHAFDPDEEYGNESVSIPVYEKKEGRFAPAGPKGKSYGYLGKCVPCGEYDEKNYETKQRAELTAVGWGDPEFAAAYQKCASAYGFWDCVTEEEAKRYTYVVCGYYAQEENDPLYHIQDFDDLAEQFQWSVLDRQEELMPECMVCHGAVRGVVWPGVEAESSGGVPAAEVEAAIGNNSAEALAALVQNTFPQEQGMERLLVYHQQDLLTRLQNPEEDTLIQIEEEAHRRQFEDVCAGYRYVLERQQEDETYQALEKADYKRLEQLNDKQKQAEFLTGQLSSFSRGLYMFWWLYVTLYDQQEELQEQETESEKLQAEIETCLLQMKNFISKYEDCQKGLRTVEQQIQAEAYELAEQVKQNKMQLVKKELERAYEPEAPVILVHGEGVQRSYRQGFQQAEDGYLPCRLHTVTEVLYEGDEGQKKITAQQVEKLLEEKLITVPKFCENIMIETVLLDDMLLCLVAEKTNKYYPTAAAPFSIAMLDWKQPWNPLELMWEITFHPVSEDEVTGSLTEHFQIGDIDLEWDGKGEETKEFAVCGSTLLTPHAAVNMKEQTKRMMENSHDLSNSEKCLLRDIERQDTLSQQLGGFQEAFLRTRDIMQIPVCWKKWDESRTGISLEKVQACIQGIQQGPLFHQDGEYLPVRAGIGKISRLWIVDSFGQMKQVIDWGKEAKVLVAESLKIQEQKCFLLPPRILQSCRIRARWLSAADGLRDAVDPYTTPVHGFVRPDFIHKVLYLYDGHGTAIGSLETAKAGCHFSPASGTYSKIEDIQDELLKKFAQNLFEREQALGELLDYLAVYLEHLLVGEASRFYEYCFGKILVLAQIAIGVEVQENYSRRIIEENEPPFMDYKTDGYEDRTFSVKMGDNRKGTDGLAGFYQQDHMDCFFASDEEAAGGGGKFVKGNAVWLHTLKDPEKKLTLLFDPLSSITVRTGFLPAAKLELKPCFYEQQLNQIQTVFPVWPVLTGQGKIELPLPEKESIDWKWLERDSAEQAQECKIDKPSQSLFAGAERIAEGYVKKEERV